MLGKLALEDRLNVCRKREGAALSVLRRAGILGGRNDQPNQ
jgi:hypothetical protein